MWFINSNKYIYRKGVNLIEVFKVKKHKIPIFRLNFHINNLNYYAVYKNGHACINHPNKNKGFRVPIKYMLIPNKNSITLLHLNTKMVLLILQIF